MPEFEGRPWPPGPWDNEPDKLQWVDEATGLQCLIVRNALGSLCGYVGVPEEHPYFGKDYDELPNLEVHGGLTYANACQGDVCHVPEPGYPDHVWWLGFDCGHAHDGIPAFLNVLGRARRDIAKRSPALERMSREMPGRDYRTLNYVRQECTDLAAQLSRVKP